MVSDVVSLDKETAENDLTKLCESWFVELSGFEQAAKDVIIKKLMNGTLVIDHKDGWKSTVRHNLSRPLDKDGDKDHLIYKFTTVGDMTALDDFKEHQNYKKMIAIVSAISRTDKGLIGRMVHRDLMLGQSVGGLFLAV